MLVCSTTCAAIKQGRFEKRHGNHQRNMERNRDKQAQGKESLQDRVCSVSVSLPAIRHWMENILDTRTHLLLDSEKAESAATVRQALFCNLQIAKHTAKCDKNIAFPLNGYKKSFTLNVISEYLLSLRLKR